MLAESLRESNFEQEAEEIGRFCDGIVTLKELDGDAEPGLNFSHFVSLMSGGKGPIQKQLMSQVREFGAAFSLFDTDEQGTIDLDEFIAGCECLGLDRVWGEAKIKALFDEVDEDGSGVMDFTEFSHMMTEADTELQLALHARIVEYREYFLLFDKEGDGELESWDVEASLWSWGNNFQGDEIQAMIDLSGADADGSGFLDFREFCQVLTGPPSRLQFMIKSQLFELKALFNLMDPLKTGLVDAKKLQQACRDVGKELPLHQVQKALAHEDRNGNGVLTFSEATLAIAVKLDLNSDGQLARPLSEQDNTGGIFHPEDAVACYDACMRLDEPDQRSLPLGDKVLMVAGSMSAKLRLDGVEETFYKRPIQRQDSDYAILGEWLMEHLGELDVFKECTPKQMTQLCQTITIREYPRGRLICEEESPAVCTYIVLQGQVTLQRRPKGRPADWDSSLLLPYMDK